METSIENDGLGVIDAKKAFEAQLLMWIKRAESNPTGSWQAIMREELYRKDRNTAESKTNLDP